MPKQILPAAGPPAPMPQASVQELRQRAEAELASQRLYAKPDAIKVPQQGELLARKEAAQRMDFTKFDAHVANVTAILRRQYAADHARDLAGATAEVMQMGNSLGTAPAELMPQTREAIDHRANQLRHLVRVDDHMALGRSVQNAFAVQNKNARAARAIMLATAGRPRLPTHHPSEGDHGRLYGRPHPFGSANFPHMGFRDAWSEGAASAVGRFALDTGFLPERQ